MREPCGPVGSQTPMRRLVVPLVALLSASACCQVSSSGLTGDVLIQTAMTTLATNSSMLLVMKGTDKTVDLVTGYEYHTSFEVSQVGTRLYDRVNITAYNGTGAYAKPVVSIIGDGVTLWRYDYVNNTYSAVNYGSYSGDQPEGYRGTLFRSITSMSEGYMSYPIMLLRQIYAGTLNGYQSWLPGVNPVVDSLGNVNYSVGQPPRRTITFNFKLGELLGVAYDDVAMMRGVVKHTDWTIQITGGWIFDSNTFSFTPPAGSRPVAGPSHH